MAADLLDEYIDAVSKALALPLEDAWRPAVRANLEAVSYTHLTLPTIYSV